MSKIITILTILLVGMSSCHRKNVDVTPAADPDQKTLEMLEDDLEDFEDDTAIEGGSSSGSYITKPINLANASTALDVRLAASVRSTSSIKCFFRLSGGEETRRIEDIPYTAFNTDGSSDTTIDPSNGDVVLDLDFKDYKFSASALPEFTSFQIKIVINGTVSALPARLKDFRTIALAV